MMFDTCWEDSVIFSKIADPGEREKCDDRGVICVPLGILLTNRVT